MMVSTGGVAFVLALACTCCYSDFSELSSREDTGGEVKQWAVHATAEQEGVQEGPKSKQTHRSEADTLPGETHQRGWKALRLLLEKTRRKLPAAQALGPDAMNTLVPDWQEVEAWMEPQPWKQNQKLPKHSPAKASLYSKHKKPVSSSDNPVSKSQKLIGNGLQSYEFEMDEPATSRLTTETPVTSLATTKFSSRTAATASPLPETPTVQPSDKDEEGSWSTVRSTNKPVASQSVSAHCGESLLHLQVKRDFFGTGQLISPSDVTLGGCVPTGLNSSSETLLFETELHKCGSVVEMTDSVLVYTFALSYVPVSTGETPAVKLHGAVVNISCQYQRYQNVSSSGLMPTWQDFDSDAVSEGILTFSLKLMNDDWMTERDSMKYFLGDVMNIKASVQQFSHVPFRVFAEECVASPRMADEAGPAYFFIEKDGCLFDSKLAQSHSHYLPATPDGALRFQLEAFRFDGVSQNMLYITCTLKAVLDSSVLQSMHKSCHFSREMNRWVNVDGNDEICSCCAEEACPHRMARSLDGFKKQTVILGPIEIQKKIQNQEWPL